MRCGRIIAIATGVLALASLAHAQTPPASPAPGTTGTLAERPAAEAATPPTPATPAAAAVQSRIKALAPGATDEDRGERAAIEAFYEPRNFEPLWVGEAGPTPAARAAIEEIQRADEWGLRARDLATPGLKALLTATNLAPDAAATGELEIAQAILKYGRYARGGRIIHPAEQLSSYLDRRPQLLKPEAILQGIVAAPDAGAYLRGLHPQHPQFERLRQKYLAHMKKGSGENLEARKILVNMEQWRWMPADLGSVYIWNNIPEFLQRVVKGNEVLRTERIVVGELGKQTPVFTRPLRRIVFKPTWIVPDSIKVNELWPSLLRGGGLMRKWALEVQTKDGKSVNWRTMDWTKTDIREYDVIQPNGPQSVMGKFKFSFPNQHTVFMHDTLPRDKYMFNVAQRTYSHGCIRVRNPMQLAELVLQAEKGWDVDKVAREMNDGPLNNTIELDRRVFVHITYFTALVTDDGKLETFRDVYGHEKRIALALDGKWNEIRKGRDHLAPVQLDLTSADRVRGSEDGSVETPNGKKGKKGAIEDLFSTLFGG